MAKLYHKITVRVASAEVCILDFQIFKSRKFFKDKKVLSGMYTWKRKLGSIIISVSGKLNIDILTVALHCMDIAKSMFDAYGKESVSD